MVLVKNFFRSMLTMPTPKVQLFEDGLTFFAMIGEEKALSFFTLHFFVVCFASYFSLFFFGNMCCAG